MAEENVRRHYRTGGKLTHAGVEMLPNGKDVEVVISHVVFHPTHEIGGRQETDVWVAYFAPNPYTKLPIVLNSTNRKRLAKLSGNPYLEEVKNFPVRMTKEETKDIQMGGKTMGLRISLIPAKTPVTTPPATPPKEREEMTLHHPKFAGAKASLAAKEVTMEQIEKRYIISEEVKTALLATDEQGTGVEKE